MCDLTFFVVSSAKSTRDFWYRSHHVFERQPLRRRRRTFASSTCGFSPCAKPARDDVAA
jgi:hypothetical protein